MPQRSALISARWLSTSQLDDGDARCDAETKHTTRETNCACPSSLRQKNRAACSTAHALGFPAPSRGLEGTRSASEPPSSSLADVSASPRTEHLFDPIRVTDALASLPNLRLRLADSRSEGEPSLAFPKARRSSRQIFRVLGNDHYEHLASLLRTLERCLGAGFDQPNLIKTRSWKDFAGCLAELHTADHLLTKGFKVEGFDAHKGNESVPDLLASRGGAKWAIEVYTPRRWEGLQTYQDAIRDALKNLDAPNDFQCAVSHDVVHSFRDGRLCAIHPGRLSADLEKVDVKKQVAVATDSLRAGLAAGHATAEVRFDALNLLTRIDCDATPALGSLPNRVVTDSLGFSCHAPERDFEVIADRAVRKCGKGQATRIPGAVACLVVDLSLSNLEGELAHPVYQRLFARTLDSHFQSIGDHGMVAFVHRIEWSKPPEVIWMRVAPDVANGFGEVWGTAIART